MFKSDEAIVTQYDKDDVEAAGLVKFDFLGLKTLDSCEIRVQPTGRRHDGAGVGSGAGGGTVWVTAWPSKGSANSSSKASCAAPRAPTGASSGTRRAVSSTATEAGSR